LNAIVRPVEGHLKDPKLPIHFDIK